MIFKSIYIKEGLFKREIIFSDKVNLIHSIKNSCGKTTLLRFMLYALGYNVPNTRKIKFSNCEVKMLIYCDKVGEILLLRKDDTIIEIIIENQKTIFILPEQIEELHKIIFGTENSNILKNLLGTFYLDQEKGWTLLNRGVVIGSIRFNIEELIRGLAGVDCSNLIQEEEQLSRDLKKYEQIFSIAQYRDELYKQSGELITDSYEEELDIKLEQLFIHKKRLKTELDRINGTLEDNKRFKQFIANMKLLVQAPNGLTFPITENNIVGLNDAIDLLIAKRKIVSNKLSSILNQINKIEKEKDMEYEQLEFYKTASQLEIFDKKIVKIPINLSATNREIKRLKKEREILRKRIKTITRNNNEIIYDISEKAIEYIKEFGLGNEETIPIDYIFTSNLKELSGAVLHKTVFAFRLAYIIAIKNILKIKLPIILDSPSGKEVDQLNIDMMMNILKRDFSEHQIIIASIFNYNFDEVNKIELKERLVEVAL